MSREELLRALTSTDVDGIVQTAVLETAAAALMGESTGLAEVLRDQVVADWFFTGLVKRSVTTVLNHSVREKRVLKTSLTLQKTLFELIKAQGGSREKFFAIQAAHVRENLIRFYVHADPFKESVMAAACAYLEALGEAAVEEEVKFVVDVMEQIAFERSKLLGEYAERILRAVGSIAAPFYKPLLSFFMEWNDFKRFNADAVCEIVSRGGESAAKAIYDILAADTNSLYLWQAKTGPHYVQAILFLHNGGLLDRKQVRRVFTESTRMALTQDVYGSCSLETRDTVIKAFARVHEFCECDHEFVMHATKLVFHAATLSRMVHGRIESVGGLAVDWHALVQAFDSLFLLAKKTSFPRQDASPDARVTILRDGLRRVNVLFAAATLDFVQPVSSTVTVLKKFLQKRESLSALEFVSALNILTRFEQRMPSYAVDKLRPDSAWAADLALILSMRDRPTDGRWSRAMQTWRERINELPKYLALETSNVVRRVFTGSQRFLAERLWTVGLRRSAREPVDFVDIQTLLDLVYSTRIR